MGGGGGRMGRGGEKDGEGMGREAEGRRMGRGGEKDGDGEPKVEGGKYEPWVMHPRL